MTVRLRDHLRQDAWEIYMDGNQKKLAWRRSCHGWLGIAALLPLMAGCGSIAPLAGKDFAPARVSDNHSIGNQQVTPTSPSSQDNSAVRQARFDMTGFKAQNEGVVTVGGKVGDNDKLPDEKASLSERMTFDQVVSATLLADPKIRAGFELINQAKADLKTSSLFPNPTLTTDGVFLPLRAFTPDRPGGPPQMDVIVGYPIDWFLFGKRAAAMASARIGVRQSESDYADLIRQRVTAAATAFYDVLEAKSLVDLARLDAKNLSEFATRTEKSIKDGGKPMVDLHRIRLDLLKSEQAVREAEAAVVVAKGKLRSLFGRTAPDPDFDVVGDLDAPLTAEPIDLEKAYALAQENRPDIQSLRLQVDKAKADIVVEERKKWPQITPGVGYSRQFQGTALGAPDADSMTATVTMTLPVFDRNQGNRWKAQSIAVQNSFLLDSALADLRAEITQAHSDFITAYRNTQAIGVEQKKTAQAVLDSIIKGKEFGGRPVIDVLDAERSYRETHRAYINSRANYWRAAYRFSSATGKQIGQP
jgi:cobalt-zinc-cadmium efflux system outer membrane protein